MTIASWLGRGIVTIAMGAGAASFAATPVTRTAIREPQGPDSSQISAALVAVLDGKRPRELRVDEWKLVGDLYGRAKAASSLAALWVDGGRIVPRAAELANAIAAADTLGLRPRDYPLDALNDALQRARSPSTDDARAAATIAATDVLLTATFVAFADDLLTGRLDPRKVEPSWHIASRTFDVGARIRAALDAVRGGRAVGEVLSGLRTDYGSYGGLLRALSRYRALESSGGWPSVPDGPNLRPGDSGTVVLALRARLAAEGYLSTAAGSNTLDAMLAGVLAEFQGRHGLTIDSVVGPGTRAALNVPASFRVWQIEANLERVRWLPPDAGQRFLVVNVPAFILYAFDGTTRAFTMRVVVGDELVSRRTPIFADTLEYIEFGPYWNVPRSIAVNEILPRARQDRGYLARNGYQVLRGWGDNAPVVDPRRLSNAALFSSRYRVRQLPGPNNALGRVKFMFPNDYAVYLHDTPARERFEDTHRAHSHGCVRVEDPEKLATFLLRDAPEWPPDRIAATLAAGRRRRVNLRNGAAVYLIYLTAFARDGQVLFRDDIYDRDARLLAAMAKQRTPR